MAPFCVSLPHIHEIYRGSIDTGVSLYLSGFDGLVVSMLAYGLVVSMLAYGLVVSMLAYGLVVSMLAYGLVVSMLAYGLVVSMLAYGLVVSLLASGTQVRGFKPDRSRRIFRAKKSSTCLPSEGK